MLDYIFGRDIENALRLLIELISDKIELKNMPISELKLSSNSAFKCNL
jgi:hypothetical protein